MSIEAWYIIDWPSVELCCNGQATATRKLYLKDFLENEAEQ